ncbi:S-layer homology domain-containing protein [Paenibacillus tuaregi]|uniref:S-layer homology domain-containing protein n=1 Tax=Paenibacillus tuaregi TaxID=1816681 RepID=UPI000AD29F7A|nr:S-layer homology domain-containing protein [Paenibacillus tuaregi]
MRQGKAGWILVITAMVCVGSLGVSDVWNRASAEAVNLPFTDIDHAYGRNEIASLYKDNIMLGTSPTLFSPDRPITRAESLTVLARLLKLEPVQGAIPAFTDVPKGRWYYSTVQAAVNIGITEGTGSGTFAPEQPLTRQEAAVWLVRSLKMTASAADGANVFIDSDEIAPWAAPSVAAAQKLGLMQGDQGKFRPNDSITREETAVLMARVLQNKNWADEISRAPAAGIQLGWQYGQTNAQYEQSVLNSPVNVMSPRWLFLEDNSVVSSYVDRTMVTWADQHNRKVWAMLGNGFDADATHTVLADSDKTASVVQQLGDLVKKYGLGGINMDFENIYPADKAGLTLFIQKLAARLHTEKAVLSVCVSPDLGTDWTEAFDYTAIGQYADYVVLMGYDEHWDGDPIPGSVSSLPWVRSGLDKLLGRVPAAKVIVALPLYTRDWALQTDGTAASSADISLPEQNKRVNTYKLKPAWDSTLQQYAASYKTGSVRHRIWMEDGRSLTRKYLLGASRHIGGFAYWYVGGESGDVWPALRNASRFSGYSF